jgi:P4 family phage/plasmid primase-like protien
VNDELSNLPEPLRVLPRYLVWREVPDPETGRVKKVPFYPGSGRQRKGLLDTEADLAQLVTLDEARRVKSNLYSGVGFALVATDEVGAFDIDKCLDDAGELIPEHAGYDLVLRAAQIGAYIEVSPSGRGLRIMGHCRNTEAYSREGVEYWGAKRYVTVTGKVWANSGQWVDLTDLRSSLGTRKTPVGDYEEDEGGIITQRTLDELQSALGAFPSEEYEIWVRMGHALKTIGDPGRALWLEWSASSDKFREADALAKWDSFNPTSTSYKAVFAEAARWGWENPRSRDVARRPIEGEVVDAADISEDAIACAFTARYRDSLRYDFNAGCWFEWNGTRWQRDGTARAFHYARELSRRLSDGQRSMCKAAVAGGAERFARADPSHATTADQWDKDPMLLGTPEGTVDLRTGELRVAAPRDMITKLTGVAPKAGKPTLWLTFLREALAGDEEAIDFLQQWFGYCLTGDTREHALAFLYGPGGNGKSVCINTLVAILGDYAVTSSMETFTASRFDRHSTDLAMLRGARLVTATETEEGRAWAEARIKQLTGGDPITARFMRQDNFTFRPEFKLMIAGNHAPSLRNVDDAMRRRLLIAPFTAKPKSPDPHLEAKLRAEHDMILHWAIQGCLSWQLVGLLRPKSITAATDDYFADQDLLAQWLDEWCDRGERRTERPSDLYQSWMRFSRAAGDDPGTLKSFASELQRRGFEPGKANGVRVYRGISLRVRGDDE